MRPDFFYCLFLLVLLSALIELKFSLLSVYIPLSFSEGMFEMQNCLLDIYLPANKQHVSPAALESRVIAARCQSYLALAQQESGDLCIFFTQRGHRRSLRGAVLLSVSSHTGKWSSQAFPPTVIQNNPMSSPNQETGSSRPLGVDVTHGQDNRRIQRHAVWVQIHPPPLCHDDRVRQVVIQCSVDFLNFML